MNAIQVKNLTKKYKDFTLDHISIDIPSGIVMGLIGENGAGKSTFIHALLGIIASDYEEVKIFGIDFKNNEKKIKEEIAVIYDDTQYDLNFNACIIGKMLSHVYQNWDNEKYLEYLRKFNLPFKKRLKEFSKGMKMKLEFAIAFSHHPKLLILDEATSGLDPVFRDEILDYLRDFSEDEEHTILMSSHITSDLDKIADYIAYIHQGKLLFIQSYDDIRDNYGIINCKKDFLDNLNSEDIISYRKEEYSYKVLIKNRLELQRIFKDIHIENATVEDVMLYVARGEKVC